MQHKSLFIFDIETIPDEDAAINLTKTPSNASVEEKREALRNYHLKITDGKSDFLRQPFHKVVAISFLEAEIIRENNQEQYLLSNIKSGGTIKSGEEELIKGFFSYLKRKTPRFVSFNGRTFDFPVLKYRAMKYGVSAPWLYKIGDKWNNYSQRYSLDWHCDLLEAFSEFGASTRVKMNEICAILDLPGKSGIDGSQVTSYFDQGRLEEIRNYCESDVINTYLLYLHYQHFTGTISSDNFALAKEDLVNYIKMNETEKFYLKEFIE
jgi:predicted PolB exonuclease-like 3'-5' exonuclease